MLRLSFQKNIKQFFKGFSLIELLISLIVISCITAAFTPVITKKLKNSSVALNAGNSEISTNCADKFSSYCKLCTKSYCIQCELSNCSEGSYIESMKCECKACSSAFPHCVQCEKGKCLKCESSAYYIKDNKCEACPSDKICDGINVYDKSYCDNPPEGYFCDGNSPRRCSEKYSMKCSRCNSASCTKCANGYYLSGGTCKPCGIEGCDVCKNTSVCETCTWSTVKTVDFKCAYCDTVYDNCQTCDTTKCLTCYGGYYLDSGNNCKPCTDLSDCLECISANKCTRCRKGYYLNNSNQCSKCEIENCVVCKDAEVCSSCKKGYYYSKDEKKCVENNNDFNCSDSNFMRIGNICVTRKNMGDNAVLKIPSSVVIANVDSGDVCYTRFNSCCWQGQTGAGACTAGSGYSGCNRTVCNYSAAKEICANFNFAGKKWRLAKESELAQWLSYSSGLGADGLMVCQGGGASDKLALCGNPNTCIGAESTCCPNCMWGGASSNGEITYGMWIGYEHLYPYTNSKNPIGGASSVRCVTEME